MSYTPNYSGVDISSLVAATLEKVKPALIDAISADVPLFYALYKKNRVEEEDGGYAISEPLLYGENNTVESYAPADIFKLERPTGITRIYYNWAFVGGTILLDEPTKFMNSGTAGIIKLTDAYIQQLQTTFASRMETMLLKDGTGNDGKDLLGIDILVEAPAGGTIWSIVGGIDSNTYTWWRNYYDNSSSTVWGTGAKAFGIRRLKHAIRACTKPGIGKPDLLLTGLNQYELFENALADNLIFNMPDLADANYVEAGFGGIRLDKVPVVYDMNMDTAHPQTWFVLNTKALRFVLGKNKSFDVSKPIELPNSDASVMKATMYGQLTLLGRRDGFGRVVLASSAS